MSGLHRSTAWMPLGRPQCPTAVSGEPVVTADYKPANDPRLTRAGTVDGAARTEAGTATKETPGAPPSGSKESRPDRRWQLLGRVDWRKTYRKAPHMRGFSVAGL